MINALISKGKSGDLTLTEVLNPPTPQSDLRKTIVACQVMFNAKVHIAGSLVDRLRPEDVTMTYQVVINMYTLTRYNSEKGKSRFHRSDLAKYGSVYNTLYNFVSARHIPDQECETIRDEGSLGARKIDDHRYVGNVPSRRMRLGEYLYFCGAITRRQLKQAFDWQSCSRPLFGQVAVRKGYLTVQDFARILSRVGKNAYFGKTACEMHLMTPAQVDDVLATQSAYNMPLGRYFVDNKLISAVEMKRYLAGMAMHNETYKGSPELRLAVA